MKKVNQKIIEKIRKLRKKGLSYDKICEKLGLSYKTVLYYLDKKYREGRRKYWREKWRKDKKYREYHKIVLEYRRNFGKIGHKKAYRIFKEKVMELRKKYNVYFPMRV
jgi:transposase